ncbi:peptide chain release factor N(5)-glutamine methyltransferase [Halomonas sp. 18H]|uniref:peptide chain release factor N(5)-glutamine methyltransferase n=1 Tax=Halomonas almeriensis TaxID=308163 RepID=UPI00223172A2|nr:MULTISPECIES: peptide chain release factor N(5)-glutamine methyltransferase [Halomonas]MCW4151585.1 peptide chain release factor N(5)-glutamine methyltransferase [Halomonas sp. 18H]MDN3552722.1 peptide chain release factor N(5)-glutamine methyltransferase [Halomonas almeriensis]
MRLDTLLARASQRLARAASPTARLDAEVLLCHVLNVDRAWLYTWGDRPLDPWSHARFDALVAARAGGQPVAYLTGEREFWGLSLLTGPSTLIPRPDTETLVAAALARMPAEEGELLDLGVGSGAVALALASERPGWRIQGVDCNPDAVALATRNAERLGLTGVSLEVGDWFEKLEQRTFSVIVANPPYLADDDPHLAHGDVRFEPRSALVAGQRGLADLYYLIEAARAHLLPGGWLLLEHGAEQAEAARRALVARGYDAVTSECDLAGHERVSLGQRPA